jgi:glycine/D-amino acid oxidase-like deaminating enzyme
MIGSAIAYGLAEIGVDTVLVDEGDVAYRAARGNFGLVWVSGKGVDFPVYAAWTRHSADAWPSFAARLASLTGVDVQHRRTGGLDFCLSEEELEDKRASLARLHNQTRSAYRYEMLDRATLRTMVPGLGPEVTGAAYSPLDGEANPLGLLRALHAGFLRRGGRLLNGITVAGIDPEGASFSLRGTPQPLSVGQVVIACGLGSKALAAGLGLSVPIAPLRGQTLVTERVAPLHDYTAHRIRQTAQGSVLLGTSEEDVGLDDGTCAPVLGSIAAHACRVFPFLARARIVRAWGALRPMPADGYPIYERSSTYPGAYVAVAHSGVTLAAAHAGPLAAALAEGRLPAEVAAMTADRFHA